MKRFPLFQLLISALMLLSPALANGQLRYGLSLGGSFAKASLSDAPGYSLRNSSGLRGGLTLEYQLPSGGLAFDASVHYLCFNTRLVPEVSDREFNYGTNFIEVPLHVKYKFWLPATHNLFAPLLLTGPSVMVNVDSRAESCPLRQKRFQCGWDVGIGVDAVNFIQIAAGYRFAFGNASRSFTTAPDASLRNSGWFLQTAILFDF